MSQNSILIIKGILYGIILIYTALYDFEYRLIPRWVLLVLICIGMVKLNLLSSCLGMILIPLPFLFVALIDSKSMGGGDIKFMVGNGFLLGIKAGILASVIGLTVAIILNQKDLKTKENGTKVSIAMAPYLGFGCFFSYLIVSFGG